MSKTTQRYGKPLYSMSTVIDGSPAPSKNLKQQWEKLDTSAKKAFNKPYDALNGKEKAELHFKINEQRHKNRERREQKDAATEARLDREQEHTA